MFSRVISSTRGILTRNFNHLPSPELLLATSWLWISCVYACVFGSVKCVSECTLCVICICLLCVNVVYGSVFCTSYERLCVHCVYGVFVWMYVWFLVRSMRALLVCSIVLDWPQDGTSWAKALANQHYGIEPISDWHALPTSCYISVGFWL